MAASQINGLDKDGATVALDSELITGKQRPVHHVRDGGIEALGALADASATTDSGAFTLIALFKRLLGKIPNQGQKVMTGSLPVVIASDQSAVPATVANNQATTTTATIANAASITAAIDLGTARLARIAMPAAWTAAVLTFQSSPDGVTYSDLYDASGNEYTVQAAAGRAILLPVSDFLSVRYLKVRSGTSAAAVAQGASRDLQLVLVN